MKAGIFRRTLVNILVLSAQALSAVESYVFAYFIHILLIIGIVYFAGESIFHLSTGMRRTRADLNTYLWYRSLPDDFLEKQEEESRSVFAKYLEAIKPKAPVRLTGHPFPRISAKSYVVLDVPSGTVLSSKDADLPLPPASTAKLATALAALKLYKINEEIAVPQFCTQIEGTKAEFLPGQRFVVSDLLKALLVYSSADASCVLSIGKSSYAEFISLMNEVVKEAGLSNSKFTNPVGLDDSEGGNLSSPSDLAKLGSAAMKNQFVKEAVQLKEFELKDLDGKYVKKLSNTNKLLTDYPGTIGIKTGTTTGAGEVLIYEYYKDNKDIMIVVMGSTDRFKDTTELINWTLRAFSWE